MKLVYYTANSPGSPRRILKENSGKTRDVLSVAGASDKVNDDARWLMAFISDTVMRLSEAAGLAVEDIHLNEEIPYVDIRQYPWRRLKTSSCQRKLPLVGCSLWAAQQAVHASTSPYRYCDGVTTHLNSASAALNKWLKPVAGSDYVIHSFRHSMRDRLRAVNCLSDMINQIGGWSPSTMGSSYGKGYELIVKAK